MIFVGAGTFFPLKQVASASVPSSNMTDAPASIEIIGSKGFIPTSDSISIPANKEMKFVCTKDGKFLQGVWASWGVTTTQGSQQITESISANVISVNLTNGSYGGIMFLVERNGTWVEVANREFNS